MSKQKTTSTLVGSIWFRAVTLVLLSIGFRVLFGKVSKFGVDFSILFWFLSAGLVWRSLGKRFLHVVSLGVVLALILASLLELRSLSSEFGNILYATLAVGIWAEFLAFSRKLRQSE